MKPNDILKISPEWLAEVIQIKVIIDLAVPPPPPPPPSTCYGSLTAAAGYGQVEMFRVTFVYRDTAAL